MEAGRGDAAAATWIVRGDELPRAEISVETGARLRYDPFGTVAKMSDEKKERGRRVEVNNGRLAMLGLFSLLSESAAPGSVPALDGIESFPKYAGNVMMPFEGDFSFF